MGEVKLSCTVASLSKMQPCNSELKNATTSATINATRDLLALSMRVLERNGATSCATNNATDEFHRATAHATDLKIDKQKIQVAGQLHELHGSATVQTRMVDTFSRKSCTVALCKGGNRATNYDSNILEGMCFCGCKLMKPFCNSKHKI